MKNKTLETVVACIAAAGIAAGCASSKTYQTTRRDEKSDRVVYSPKSSISPEAIKLPEFDRDALTMEKANLMLDYVNFKNIYKGKIESINELIQGEIKQDKLHAEIKGLAGELERDSNPYAGMLLQKVRDFSYIVCKATHDVTKTRHEKTEYKPDDGIVLTFMRTVIGAALDLATSPLYVAEKIFIKKDRQKLKFLGGTRAGLGETQKYSYDEMINSTSWDIVRISPYYGTEATLRSGVPGKRLEEELRSIVRVN